MANNINDVPVPDNAIHVTGQPTAQQVLDALSLFPADVLAQPIEFAGILAGGRMISLDEFVIGGIGETQGGAVAIAILNTDDFTEAGD